MTRWTWRAWPLPWPGAGRLLAGLGGAAVVLGFLAAFPALRHNALIGLAAMGVLCAVALLGFVAAAVLPTRSPTRIDVYPLGRPEWLRVRCRYTRRVYPISTLRGVWVRHGVAPGDGTRLILAIDRGALGVRLLRSRPGRYDLRLRSRTSSRAPACRWRWRHQTQSRP
ncbi:hypothetical protein K1W54_17075 [Micromonospora sp. CPCC 205371]|nr:hypothetical protein [Micromonospora sp. CPCC 205371]